MGILSRAEERQLLDLVSQLDDLPNYERLRGPESGLVMVRGRTGGSGSPFNLGEMTVTRCSVRTEDGALGHAYVGGRRPGHAERAAVLDALLQGQSRRADLMKHVIFPLGKLEDEKRAERSQESAATKVDFFTLVRGEDE